MIKYLFLLVTFLCFTTVIMIAVKIHRVSVEPVHYHANFAVFENGIQVDFSKPEFMHISPCTDDEHVSTDPKENVHLHDGIGNVVHVHASGITWKVFFGTLRFDLPKTFFVYQNKHPVDASLLDLPIQDKDTILIEIGSQSGNLESEYEKVGTNASEYDAGRVGVERCGTKGPRNLWQRFKIAFNV